MKLTSEQTAAVRRSVNIDPLDDDNPALEPLQNAFGDHTFYVVSEGLFVLELVNDASLPGEPAEFIQVAAWTDEQRTALRAVEPQRTNTVIDLALSATDEADGEDTSQDAG